MSFSRNLPNPSQQVASWLACGGYWKRQILGQCKVAVLNAKHQDGTWVNQMRKHHSHKRGLRRTEGKINRVKHDSQPDFKQTHVLVHAESLEDGQEAYNLDSVVSNVTASS
jgi:hypothetical protein